MRQLFCPKRNVHSARCVPPTSEVIAGVEFIDGTRESRLTCRGHPQLLEVARANRRSRMPCAKPVPRESYKPRPGAGPFRLWIRNPLPLPRRRMGRPTRVLGAKASRIGGAATESGSRKVFLLPIRDPRFNCRWALSAEKRRTRFAYGDVYRVLYT